MHPAQIALSFVERINQHDVEGLVQLMSEDHLFVDALGARVQGSEALRQGWMGYFRWFPDYTISCTEVLEKGDVVALFGMACGTYNVGGKLLPENRWEIPAAWKAVVRGERVAEWRVYADNEPARRIMAANKCRSN